MFLFQSFYLRRKEEGKGTFLQSIQNILWITGGGKTEYTNVEGVKQSTQKYK